jgi:hypothetical protein
MLWMFSPGGTRKAALTLLVSYLLAIIAVTNGIRGTLTRNKHAVLGAIFFVLSGMRGKCVSLAQYCTSRALSALFHSALHVGR